MNERDHLTQLFTRAAFDAALQQHFQQATPECPAGLILGDVDHFKKVNDCNGHQAGDAVLTELARRLRQTVEGKGFAYRYGGEEFAVVLPNHTADEALAVAERVRRSVEGEAVGAVSVTSSYGVAVVPTHASTIEQWLKMADEALYDAKHLGRNLVRLSGEPPPEAQKLREPLRKRAEPGAISDELKEAMRMQILRNGFALCPTDRVPLAVQDLTTMGESGKSFLVHCPGCGFNTNLPGPGRS